MTTKATTQLALNDALALAQSQMETPKFDSKNNFSKNGKNNYASLAEILRVARPALSANGIAFTQEVRLIEGVMFVETKLRKGEEIISGLYPMSADRNNSHGTASANTYGRRYGLSNLCGIAADEDDDGDQAQANPPKPITRQELVKLEARLAEVGGNREKFCICLGIPSLDALPADRLAYAHQQIDDKARQNAKEAAKVTQEEQNALTATNPVEEA